MQFIRTILKNVILATQIKHYVCITNINQFLPFREIVILHSETHALHSYTVVKTQKFCVLKKVECDDCEYFSSK